MNKTAHPTRLIARLMAISLASIAMTANADLTIADYSYPVEDSSQISESPVLAPTIAAYDEAFNNASTGNFTDNMAIKVAEGNIPKIDAITVTETQTITQVETPPQIVPQAKTQVVVRPAQTNTTPKLPQATYSFPAEIQQGYWAMEGNLDNSYIVLKFNNDNTAYYNKFVCHADGTYSKQAVQLHTFAPTQNGAMALIVQGKPTNSTLTLVGLEPKKSMTLRQRKANASIHDYTYRYETSLHPICSQ